MTTLRIYLSQWHDPASDCPWALCDDSGTLLQSGCGALASMPKAQGCIGVLASDRTLCSEVEAPPGPRRRWLNALPFLAEEHTLSDPDENHVVPGASRDGRKLTVFVTNKPWLHRVADACRMANLHLRKVVPESALPPVAPGSWTLVWNGRGGFLCTAPLMGVELDSGDARSAPLTLQLLLEAGPAPDKIELRFSADLPQGQRAVPAWQGVSPRFSRGPDWDWRTAPIPPGAPNLLWGELAPPARPLEWWPKLRPAALLLLAVLGVEALGANVQWAELSWQKRALSREMERAFRQAFGNEAAVVNAPLQMQRNLADLRHRSGSQDDGDFLPLLDTAAARLAALPAGSIRELRYEAGRLDIEIRLGGLAEAAVLRDKFRNIGMSAHTDVQDTGNGVNVRLTLRQGGAP